MVVKRISRIVMYYYVYCVLCYLLITICWNKYVQWLTYDKDAAIQLYEIYMGAWLMLLGAVMKQSKTNLRVFSLPILSMGLFLEFKLIFTHYDYIFSMNVVAILILLSVIVSCWALLNFIFGVDIEFNKVIGKKVMKYYIFVVISLYVFVLTVGRHYAGIINRIASSGSLFVVGGLTYEQMIVMIEKKSAEAYLILYSITLMLLSVLFIAYKRALKAIGK